MNEILTKAIEKAMSNYDITYDGRVFNKASKREVKGSIDHKGYRYISVYMPEIRKSKKIKVHRMVALRYLDNPENLPHINHKDGDPLNNHAGNLEWCTISYNVQDGFNRGRVIWNRGNISKERALFYAKKYPRQLFWFLTRDEFAIAKALWGEGHNCDDHPQYDIYHNESNGWQHHLQQMVIAPDPLKYLGEHL